MAKTKKAEELVNNYITQKAVNFDDFNDGLTSKKDLMKKAGYTDASIKSNNPELTKLYAVKVEDLINKTGFILSEFVESVNRDVREGMIEDLTITQKVKTLSLLTSIFKGLSPTFKQKQTIKDEEGNVKTVWQKIN